MPRVLEQDRLKRPKAARLLSPMAFLWLLAVLILSSDTGTGILEFYLVVFAALGLVGVWVVFGMLYLAVDRRKDGLRSRSWLVLPLCLACGVAVWMVPPPYNPLFKVRFRWSEASLTRHAEASLASTGDKPVPRSVGLFLIQRVESNEGQVRYITTSCGVVDSCGLVYSPGGPPQRWQEDEFHHLDGAWWHVYEGF